MSEIVLRPAASRSRQLPAAVEFAAAFAAAVALRLPLLNRSALWIDEAFSLYYVHKGVAAFVGPDWVLEPTPPLYYGLLWLWTGLVGSGEASARLLSTLLTGVACSCVYGAGTVLGGRQAGRIAAAIFACLPLVFEYSLEIRAYSLFLLMAASCLWAFVRLLRRLDEERAPNASAVFRLATP